MSTALTTPVLVLNKHWAAIRVVPAHKALSYLVRGVAEAIEAADTAGAGKTFANYDFASWQELSALKAQFEPERHAWVRTVREALAVPAIVRLVRFDRHRPAKVKFNRRNLYARDRSTCQYCGKRFTASELNLDHVVPRSRGGGATWDNIVCSCVICNTKKADRTPAEAGMRLIRPPHKPEAAPALPRVRHDSWKHFVDAAYWNVELVE